MTSSTYKGAVGVFFCQDVCVYNGSLRGPHTFHILDLSTAMSRDKLFLRLQVFATQTLFSLFSEYLDASNQQRSKHLQ